jgi:hypothetical protein
MCSNHPSVGRFPLTKYVKACPIGLATNDTSSSEQTGDSHILTPQAPEGCYVEKRRDKRWNLKNVTFDLR